MQEKKDSGNEFQISLFNFIISCDGLLAKKQLGWSCASCDKELDKYKGQLGDFINWAVFPRKETSSSFSLKKKKFSKGPIFALHYANEISKRAHETAYYKNFETE